MRNPRCSRRPGLDPGPLAARGALQDHHEPKTLHQAAKGRVTLTDRPGFHPNRTTNVQLKVSGRDRRPSRKRGPLGGMLDLVKGGGSWLPAYRRRHALIPKIIDTISNSATPANSGGNLSRLSGISINLLIKSSFDSMKLCSCFAIY